MEGGKTLPILVADDDPNDVALLLRALKKAGVNAPAHVCRDGAEAIDYLKGEGDFADRNKFPFPRVLVTDLKMPKCDGFDLLLWLKEHPACSVIPTIVLSASAQDEDVKRAYQLGANCYFCKPVNSSELVELVKLVHTFWSIAQLPAVPRSC